MKASEVDRTLELSGEALVAALTDLVEGQYLERKSGRVSAKDLAVPLVAMANSEGGVIVVGLHGGQPDGVPEGKVNDLRQASLDHTEPPVRCSVDEREVPGSDGVARTLLILRVDPSESMHRLTNGTVYLRVGDESRKLSAAQSQELAYDRGAVMYEAAPVRMEVADLDGSQLEAYRSVLGASTVESMLRARDLVDRQGSVTTAACLLFDDRPQTTFPNALIRVLRYGDTERGTGRSMSLEDGADLRFEGSIPAQIHRAAATIEDLMPKWRQLTDAGRFEPRPRIPRDAWLEGLVNAVIHRSYSMMGDHIRVEIFPNRIEIHSPGRFPGIVNPDRPLEIDRYARNPRIARVCSDLGITRELGEGIRRIFEEMRGRGLVDPVYTQSSAAVRLVLWASDALPSEVLARLTPSARAILDVMRQGQRPMGTGEISDLADVTRMTATRALRQLQDEGLVTWDGRTAKDPRATWRMA